MNHKVYTQVVTERLKEEERQNQQSEKDTINVVYTSAGLVKVGQQIMRARRKARPQPLQPA
jgi:hypothetical protein